VHAKWREAPSSADDLTLQPRCSLEVRTPLHENTDAVDPTVTIQLSVTIEQSVTEGLLGATAGGGGVQQGPLMGPSTLLGNQSPLSTPPWDSLRELTPGSEGRPPPRGRDTPRKGVEDTSVSGPDELRRPLRPTDWNQ